MAAGAALRGQQFPVVREGLGRLATGLALVRQARKDDTTSKADVAKGLLPRQGRAYRDIFQLVKTRLNDLEDAAHIPPEIEEVYKP